MTIDAGKLDSYQRCPRKYLLNESGHVRRWNPKALYVSRLRSAILSLSSGITLEKATAEAVARTMELAANPGLDTDKDPFTTARSLCSMIKTSLARIHACRIPSLARVPHILLSDTVSWSCNALSDGKSLHCWTAVERLSDAALTRELHSWKVVGDCAVTGLPMQLHVVEIGRQGASGKFNSPWCRTFAHPIVIHRWAFQQKNGKPLQGKWKPIYFEDGRNDPQTWIELMDRDGVRILKDVAVKSISPDQADKVKRDILIEASRIAALTRLEDEPLRRTSCDLPVCGWKSICYAP